MRLLAISDLHLGAPANREALAGLGHFPDDWLIVAGDVAESFRRVGEGMAALRRRFAKVIWVPGNHELWSIPGEDHGLRGGERPRLPFWLLSGLGSTAVVGFALLEGGRGTPAGDLLMVAAILLCGLGYAEGAVLSRRLGGWQVISWALLLALPLTVTLALLSLPDGWAAIGTGAWLGLTYVSLFSMLLGFVFWYRGLALGGIAGVGQLQLLQPLLGLLLAALLLHEPVAWSMIAATGVVVLCVAGARRFT